jgi:hypothetical protein
MDDTKEIIRSLEALDLSTYPVQEINKLLGNIGKIAAVITRLHPGKIIIRARPNNNGERFSKVNQISYKPAEFNKTYQRASTPNNTMFYGSTLSENRKEGELNISRMIGLFESIPFMRDLNSNGDQVITYSMWRVMKEIPLLSIIHYKGFRRDNSMAEEQRLNFEKFLSGYESEVGEKARLFTDFLAKEFAKNITPKDYDYLISALYTEISVYNGSGAGVIYPSVRTEGDGFNVAIHPSLIDNQFLIPYGVAECTVYKRGAASFIDNESVAYLENGQTEFELQAVEPKFHAGRDIAMRNLYPENY